VRVWGKGTEAAEYLLRTDLNFYPDCSNRYLTGLIFVSCPLRSFPLRSRWACSSRARSSWSA